MTLLLHYVHGHLLTCSESKVTDEVLLFFVFFSSRLWWRNILHHCVPVSLSPMCPFLVCFTRKEKQSAGQKGAVTRSLAGENIFSPDRKVGNINGWLMDRLEDGGEKQEVGGGHILKA